MTIVPSILAGWAYEMLDTTARTTASFQGFPNNGFTVSTPSIGRSAAVLGVQASIETGTPLQVFAGYTALLSATASAQSVTGGLRYRW